MPPQNSDGLVFLAPVIDHWTPVQLEIDHDKFGDCWWQIYIAATPNENDRAIGLAMFTTKDGQKPANDDLTGHKSILWAAQPATHDPLVLYRMGLLVKALPEKCPREFFPGVLAALINPTHPQFTYRIAKVRQTIGPDKFAAILSCDARPALPMIRVMRAYGIQPDLRGMTRAMVAGQLPWTKYIRSQGILHPQDLADRTTAKKTLLVAYQPWIEAYLASQDKPSKADMKQEEAYFKDRLEEEIVAEYIRGLGDEDTDGISPHQNRCCFEAGTPLEQGIGDPRYRVGRKPLQNHNDVPVHSDGDVRRNLGLVVPPGHRSAKHPQYPDLANGHLSG